MTPLVVVVGAAAGLLLVGLVVPIRKGFGVSVDVNSFFLQERLWHVLEPFLVPLLAVGAALLMLRGSAPHRFLSGALLGLAVASILRNVMLLASTATNTGSQPGVFVRLAGAVVLVVGAVMAMRRSRQASSARPSGGKGVAPVLWGVGVALVVAGIVLPVLKADSLGLSASIVNPHDPERNWYILEPLVLAVGTLGVALWWWLGRPDRSLLVGFAGAAGVALTLHFLVYAVAPVLVPGFSPGPGGFAGLAGGGAIAVGGLLAFRRARAEATQEEQIARR